MDRSIDCAVDHTHTWKKRGVWGYSTRQFLASQDALEVMLFTYLLSGSWLAMT